GQQARLPCGRSSVAIAQARVFTLDVEGPAGFGGEDQIHRSLLEFVERFQLVIALDLAGEVVHRSTQRLTAIDGRVERRQILNAEVGVVRVAGAERLMPPAEERASAQLPGERRVARDGEVRG